MANSDFWEIDESDLEPIRNLVSSTAHDVYRHIFDTGELWIDFNEESGVKFEFTDENFEFRKIFSIDSIKFCGVEDGKESVIRALESLIERIKNVSGGA